MNKIISTGNCWVSFFACMTDRDLSFFERCSTVNDDWKEQTEATLESMGLFYAEVNPGLVSQLPHGALVGAHINGINKPHIVIAKVIRDGPRHAFEVEHDPSQRRQPGTLINPSRIVLLCKLIK